MSIFDEDPLFGMIDTDSDDDDDDSDEGQDEPPSKAPDDAPDDTPPQPDTTTTTATATTTTTTTVVDPAEEGTPPGGDELHPDSPSPPGSPSSSSMFDQDPLAELSVAPTSLGSRFSGMKARAKTAGAQAKVAAKAGGERAKAAKVASTQAMDARLESSGVKAKFSAAQESTLGAVGQASEGIRQSIGSLERLGNDWETKSDDDIRSVTAKGLKKTSSMTAKGLSSLKKATLEVAADPVGQTKAHSRAAAEMTKGAAMQLQSRLTPMAELVNRVTEDTISKPSHADVKAMVRGVCCTCSSVGVRCECGRSWI
jgi:hypothetical protein